MINCFYGVIMNLFKSEKIQNKQLKETKVNKHFIILFVSYWCVTNRKSFIGFIYLWNLFLKKNSYLFVFLFNVLFLKSRGFKISANNMSFTCLPLCIFPQPSTLSCLLILFIVGPRIWLVFCERNNWFIHVLLMTVSFQFYIL